MRAFANKGQADGGYTTTGRKEGEVEGEVQ